MVEIVGCIVFKLPSDNVDHSHQRYVPTKFNRTVSRFGACASYDEAHPILLFINQSDSQRYLMRPVQNKLSSQITNSIFSWSDDIFREFWSSMILLAFVGQVCGYSKAIILLSQNCSL